MPELTGMRVAVAGAGGFIGRSLVSGLSDSGAITTAITRGNAGSKYSGLPLVEVVKTDLRDASAATEALKNCDILFNFAYDMRASGDDNLRLFDGIVSAAETAGTRRIIHASSIVVYDGWPDRLVDETSSRNGAATAYRAAKIEMESRLEALSARSNVVTVCLQPTLVYGPYSYLWTDMPIERLLAGGVVLPSNPDGLCHAVHVDDVVQAALRAAAADIVGAGRFIVSGPQPVTWQEFYGGYADMLGRGTIELREFPRPDKTPSIESPDRTIPLSARVSSALRNCIGKDGVDWLRRRALALKRMRGPSVHVPGADEVRLYLSRGGVSTNHAREVLGYVPKYGLASGLAATKDYVREKYAAHLGKNWT